MKKIFLMAIAMICFMPSAGGCFEILSYVDKNQISQEDSVLLTVVVDGGKAQLDLSMITDFKVMSRGTSSTMNYINGKLERKATYQYLLIPRAKGNLLIPPIKATRDDETIFSKQIVIQVSEQQIKQGEQKALFATSGITKQRLFVGEQAVYTLRFFTSRRLGGLGYETVPVFDGFTSKPFGKEKNYGQNIDGIQYQVTEVNFIVIPQFAGNFTIDPAVLIAKVMVKSRRDPAFDSFFNDSFFSSNSYKPMRIASNPVEVQVVSLPVYQGAGKFSGLVGQFDIEAIMDEKDIKAGDSATLTLKISGAGNIMDAVLPDLTIDDHVFKVYDDNPVENIILTSSGYEGYKIFKKALVPISAGKFDIPPVGLVYFDVKKERYQTAFTDTVHLTVLPSGELHQAGSSLQDLSLKQSIVKKEVQYENKDIFDIKEGLDVLEDFRQVPALFFLMYMFAPVCLFLVVKMFVMMQKKEIPVKKQMEDKAKQYIKKAGKMDISDDHFLGHLYAALVAMVLSKANKKSESLTMEETQQILADARVEKTLMDKIVHLFETIDSVRFGGSKIDENKARSLLDETKKIFKLICMVICCLGVFSVMPYKGVCKNMPDTTAETTAEFLNGINQYKAGHYTQAARSFETIAKAGIQNPYLFYNIGNAYLKSEDIGHAILWYERAIRLMPTDPDLNFNLEHARSFVTDKKEASPDIVGMLFFWDKWFKIKDIQIAAICLCSLFFLWASIRILRHKRILSGVGIALLAAVVFVTIIVGEHYYSDFTSPHAVIIDSQVSVRSGISETATKLFSLHKGTTVVVDEKKNGYLKIIFSKGKTGWIKDGQAIII